jgi:hypothetical protein
VKVFPLAQSSLNGVKKAQSSHLRKPSSQHPFSRTHSDLECIKNTFSFSACLLVSRCVSRGLVQRGPRDCGKETSVWSLPLLAQVSFEHGLTRELVTGETIRQAIRRLGLNWKRVKHRIGSPDPLYQQKNETD